MTWVIWYQNVSILDFIGAKDDSSGGYKLQFDLSSTQKCLISFTDAPRYDRTAWCFQRWLHVLAEVALMSSSDLPSTFSDAQPANHQAATQTVVS